MLLVRAGKRPISVYMRDLALADAGVVRGKVQYNPAADRVLMAQALGLIGQSEAFSNLSEIARLARLGALPVTEETEAAIQQACQDISEVKTGLMKALHIKER